MSSLNWNSLPLNNIERKKSLHPIGSFLQSSGNWCPGVLFQRVYISKLFYINRNILLILIFQLRGSVWRWRVAANSWWHSDQTKLSILTWITRFFWTLWGWEGNWGSHYCFFVLLLRPTSININIVFCILAKLCFPVLWTF